jgi:hypothetical protein
VSQSVRNECVEHESQFDVRKRRIDGQEGYSDGSETSDGDPEIHTGQASIDDPRHNIEEPVTPPMRQNKSWRTSQVQVNIDDSHYNIEGPVTPPTRQNKGCQTALVQVKFAYHRHVSEQGNDHKS